MTSPVAPNLVNPEVELEARPVARKSQDAFEEHHVELADSIAADARDIDELSDAEECAAPVALVNYAEMTPEEIESILTQRWERRREDNQDLDTIPV